MYGVLWLTAALTTAKGDVLVGWDVSGLTNFGPESLSPTYLAEGLDASELGKGAGIYNNPSGVQWPNAFGGNTFHTASDNTKTLAITNGYFIDFTVILSSAESVSLSSLEANFRRTNAGGNTFLWQYSLNGGEFADIGSAYSYTTTNTTNAQPSISLSGISSLQSLTLGDSTTFRLLVWRDSGSFNGGSWAISDLSGYDLALHGTSAVPEPSTWALIAVSGVFVVLIARRRQSGQTA